MPKPQIQIDHRGVAYIAGTTMKVRSIVIESIRLNRTPQEIHESHENLTLEQIHAALAYFNLNQERINAEIEEEDRFVNTMQRSDNLPTRAELLERARQSRTA